MLVNTIPIIEFEEFKNIENIFNSAIGISLNFEQLQFPETIQFLFDTRLSHFICLDFRTEKIFSETNFKENIRQLIRLSFNLHYFKINNNPVLAILSSSQDLTEIISEIKNEFLKQGYDNLLLFELNENNNDFSENADWFYTNIELKQNEIEGFYDFFYNKNVIDKMFFVFSTREKTKLIIEQINSIEKLFENTETKLYTLFESIQKIKYENRILQNVNKLLQARIQNAEINQKLLRKDAENIINWYKEEIVKIKDWYYLQYDILPRWYKRIGHVVKRFLKNDRTKK